MSRNGELKDSELASVDDRGNRLAAWAAAVWFRMVHDAAKDGITLGISPPSTRNEPPGLSGYRDLAGQTWLWQHPIGPVPIAPPGHSTHGLGTALDVDTGLGWIAVHANRYGVTRPFLSRGEPWHLQFTTTLASLDLTPITPLKRRNTMSTLYHDISTKPTLFALGGDSPGTPANWLETIDYEGVALPWAAAHGNSVGLTHDSFVAFKNNYLAPLKIAGGIEAGVTTPITVELKGTVTPA